MNIGFDHKSLCGWLGPDLAAQAWQAVSATPEFVPFRIAGDFRPRAELRVVLWDAAKKVLGKHIRTFLQEIGDCVSFGAGNAVDYLTVVEIATGGNWTFHEAFQPWIYGTSRCDIGGQHDYSDGSTGSWAAAAVARLGVLFYDDQGVPPYSGQVAKQWGYSGPPKEDYPIAKPRPVKSCARVTTFDQVRDAIANGYPVTVASDVGFEGDGNMQGEISNGKCWGVRGGSWGHQMCIIGVDTQDARPGAFIINSWGGDHVWPNQPDARAPGWLLGRRQVHRPDGGPGGLLRLFAIRRIPGKTIGLEHHLMGRAALRKSAEETLPSRPMRAAFYRGKKSGPRGTDAVIIHAHRLNVVFVCLLGCLVAIARPEGCGAELDLRPGAGLGQLAWDPLPVAPFEIRKPPMRSAGSNPPQSSRLHTETISGELQQAINDGPKARTPHPDPSIPALPSWRAVHRAAMAKGGYRPGQVVIISIGQSDAVNASWVRQCNLNGWTFCIHPAPQPEQKLATGINKAIALDDGGLVLERNLTAASRESTIHGQQKSAQSIPLRMERTEPTPFLPFPPVYHWQPQFTPPSVEVSSTSSRWVHPPSVGVSDFGAPPSIWSGETCQAGS